MPTETFENMTLAFRQKMLEVSTITGPKKARHTYPDWSACWSLFQHAGTAHHFIPQGQTGN